MPDTTTTPNMSLPVPVPSTAPGPAWATNIVADMNAIDSHNHSSGQGVQISPSGLDINSDLTFGSNNATALRSARFTAQVSPLALASDLGCLYVSGVDLYYNDENGNQVRITTGGNVNAGAGSITGLPSGTASASFSGGTFVFQSATNTGASIRCGPIEIGSTTVATHQTIVASNASQSVDISLVLPTVAPAANNVMASDGSGNMFWDSTTGTSSLVRSSGAQISTTAITTPTFFGTPLGTITAGTYSPTITNGTGTTTATGVWFYQRVGNVLTVSGTAAATPSSGQVIFTTTVPILPTSNFSAANDAAGVATTWLASATAQDSTKVEATTSAKTITVNIYTTSDTARTLKIFFTYNPS